ncbi:MAG: general secretion pathway protein GspB [Comamonadaceae bacterium]
MSYILDALKRADAERERGAVPGLHARQLTTSGNQPATGKSSRLGLAISVTLTLGILAVGLWLWQKPDGATQLASVQPTALPATTSIALAAPVSALTPAPAPAPAPAAQPAPAAAVLPTVSASSPGVSAVVTSAAAPTPTETPAQKPLPSAKVAAGRVSPTATPSPAAPPLLSELSEDFRRALPPLTVSGAVYSDNPGQRLLLVNGQVVTQGGPAAAEVTLEEIGARSSVFSYRGTRFRLAH